jgi:hypothetical protein
MAPHLACYPGPICHEEEPGGKGPALLDVNTGTASGELMAIAIGGDFAITTSDAQPDKPVACRLCAGSVPTRGS